MEKFIAGGPKYMPEITKHCSQSCPVGPCRFNTNRRTFECHVCFMVTRRGRYMYGVQIGIITDIIIVFKRKSMDCVIRNRLFFVYEY